MGSTSTSLKEGQLVTFDPIVKDLQNFPFMTCGYEGKGAFVLYEKITIENFPLYNDFEGNKTIVKRGETGILLSQIGIPPGISGYQLDRPDLDFNVYTVLINGHKVQVFGVDLV